MTKIGDYIRTEKGIAKVIDRNDETRLHYPDAWVTDVELNMYDCRIKSKNYVYNGDVLNSSPRILDLIEKGDFIDGKEVVRANHFADGFNRIELFGGKTILNKTKITSIITKEQIESIGYRLEE